MRGLAVAQVEDDEDAPVEPPAGELGAAAGADGVAGDGLALAELEPAAAAWGADAALPPPSACGWASAAAFSAGAPVLDPLRKSVTYQPDPFSWNPAAVTCFLKLSAPHAGQVVSKGSEIFWRTSFA